VNLDLGQARDTLAAFAIDGELMDVRPHRRGLIHDSFISSWQSGGTTTRYLHQHMNEVVFRDIPALMHNVERVCRHLRERAAAARGTLRHLRLVPTRDGVSYAALESGPWRTYEFVENTESIDHCRGPEQAHEAARAFGEFQAELADLDPAELRETIPDFFDSRHRWRQLERAVERDGAGRVAEVTGELVFAHDREEMVSVVAGHLAAGEMPTRIVHGDTKLNNVLFDRDTGAAVCIVDLDTCMPAYSLYDFGDLVRFTAATSDEDERDLALAGTDRELYRALLDGYLVSAAAFLTPLERQLMPFAARLVTFTIGLRFLTDHLDGDVYFKIERPGHNLDRARVQFEMVRAMEAW